MDNGAVSESDDRLHPLRLAECALPGALDWVPWEVCRAFSKEDGFVFDCFVNELNRDV
jgi:hypothetical protein